MTTDTKPQNFLEMQSHMAFHSSKSRSIRGKVQVLHAAEAVARFGDGVLRVVAVSAPIITSVFAALLLMSGAFLLFAAVAAVAVILVRVGSYLWDENVLSDLLSGQEAKLRGEAVDVWFQACHKDIGMKDPDYEMGLELEIHTFLGSMGL